MWSIFVSYPYAYIGHTFNGVFIYDITEPEKPKIVEQILLPIYKNDPEFRNIISPDVLRYHPPVLPFDPEEVIYSPVCGIAPANGYLYIASGYSDLSIVCSEEYFHEPESDKGKKCARLNAGSFYDQYTYGTDDGVSVYQFAHTNIHAAIQTCDMIYIAGGMGGILAVSAQTMEECFRAITHGPALDIAIYEDTLYVAEGDAGLSIWKIQNNGFSKIAVFSAEGEFVRQVVISENGKFALLHVGATKLWILNISDVTNPSLVMTEKSSLGLIYDHHISTVGVNGRYYSCFWNASYCKWFDLGGDTPLLMPWVQHRLGFSNGITALENSDLQKFLVVNRGGYAILDCSTSVDFSKIDVINVPGASIAGKPTIYNNILFVSNRVSGQVYFIDIRDISHPRLLRELNFKGYPGLITVLEDRIAIPLDNQGIAICKIHMAD